MQIPPEPSRIAPDRALSARFSALKRSGTKPERLVRQELHRRGRRFRVQFKVDGLPRRRVDIAFTRARLIVLVDGCFWHGCSEHGTLPRINRDWWRWKLGLISERDADTNQQLTRLGWRVVRIWEHVDPKEAADAVELLLGGKNTASE